jgi:glutamate formiminotransferase
MYKSGRRHHHQIPSRIFSVLNTPISSMIKVTLYYVQCDDWIEEKRREQKIIIIESKAIHQ